MKFTSQGKAAIETILRCMEDADAAFKSLNADENKACFDFHNETSSLNHCTRWGLTAAQELHAEFVAAKVNAKNWSVVLTLENKTEFQWAGAAEDKNHAEGLAIANATEKTGEQVLEVVSVTSPNTEQASA
jgi:hypothetical protein